VYTAGYAGSAYGVAPAAFAGANPNVGNGIFILLSKFREGTSLEPSVALYNVFNMSNFASLNGQLANVADAGGAVGAVSNYLNGPNNLAVENGLRVQRGAVPTTSVHRVPPSSNSS
jgi:hypothetical protein